MTELPLFPLHTVLFPGGRLALRIFEPRYVDLVGRCLREDVCFGVCLIRAGTEAGAPPIFREVGTAARIVDWSQRADGLLGITVRGERRFRVRQSRVQKDNLVLAEIDWFEEMPAVRVGPEYARLLDLLAEAGATDPPVEDAAMLGFRLAELMPLPPGVRQELLEIDAPAERLARMDAMLKPRRDPGPGARDT